MDYSFIAIMAVVIMACIGIVFGFILASADKKFAMEENPLIGEVKEALPQGQCGACGFAGCANMRKPSSSTRTFRLTSVFLVKLKSLLSSLN